MDFNIILQALIVISLFYLIDVVLDIREILKNIRYLKRKENDRFKSGKN